MINLKIDPEFQSQIPPLTDDEFKQLEENILVVVITVITTTLERKPVTGSQRKTVSAAPPFSAPATIHEASTSQTTSLPASSRKSFPVK